jgi:hypothetical protein
MFDQKFPKFGPRASFQVVRITTGIKKTELRKEVDINVKILVK